MQAGMLLPGGWHLLHYAVEGTHHQVADPAAYALKLRYEAPT
jgi:hypothetical protein